MKEQQFRNKITYFSFVFSLLVVWVHSYNAELYLGQTPAAAMLFKLEHVIGERVAQIAVPGFFMISSFLFFRNFTWEKLEEKWNSRIRSVLVPFILWNFIYYMGYVIGSRLPWMKEVMGKGTIPFTLAATVDAIIFYTYNYVFWYLYQLILLIILSPVLYLLLKRRWIGIAYNIILWILLIFGVKLPQVNLDALIYYSLAAFLALHGRAVVEGMISRLRLAVGLGMIILGIIVYQIGLRYALTPLFVVCRIVLVGGLWLAVPGEKLPQPKVFMTCNFFLYATHFLFVRLINKIGARLLPALFVIPFCMYLLMPLITLAISYGISICLRRLTPQLWKWLNGGR